MKLNQIKGLLNCRGLPDQKAPNLNITHAFASDLMSDILTDPCPGAVLLTGLANVQAVRTCKIARACAIVFCKNKNPSKEAVQLAQKFEIPVLMTDLPLFDACGILYTHGIRGIIPED